MLNRQNFHILILEDNPSFLIDLEIILESIGFKEVSKVSSAEKALIYLQNNQPDLILADIQLAGELSGIDFAMLIKNKEIPLIFLTAHHNPETFAQARPTQPIAFLGKPVNKMVLESTIQLALDKKLANALAPATEMETSTRFGINDLIFIRHQNNLEKVRVGDIAYIHSDGNYCYIHVEKKKYILKISLINLSKKLPDSAFLRIHRSYLVQKNLIQRIETKTNVVYLHNERLPIGRKYRKIVLEQLNMLS